jgi:monoamine oxidase
MRISRRGLLLGAAALPFGGACRPSEPVRSVVVIGAGTAGLAAARALSRAGAKTAIIEARSRIGGRIHTDRSRGWAVDLGASWLHGPDGNPLRKEIERLRMPRAETDYDRFGAWIEESGGARRLSDSEVRRMERLFERIVDGLDEKGSLRAALDRAMDREGVSAEDAALVEFAVAAEIGNEYGETPDRLAARFYGEAKESQGRDWLFPEGYDRLIQDLATGLEVHLGVEAVRIRAEKGHVEIDTSIGPLTANAAIVTVPLAILKSGRLRIDPWPEEHRRAIDSLGVASLSKAFLEFPRPFWPDGLDAFGRIGDQQERWCSFLPLPGRPLLLGLNHGGFARELEALPAEDHQRAMLEALRALFGSSVPEPVEGAAAAWSLDPWALGSYSCLAPGASAASHRALAEPIAGRIHLAGEHTSAEHPSTVHGAYVSGLLAARRILDGRSDS